MRLIRTSADCILELAFQAGSGSLVIHGERSENSGLATVEAGDNNGIVSLKAVKIGRNAALAPNGRTLAGINEYGGLSCQNLPAQTHWRLDWPAFQLCGLQFAPNSEFVLAYGDQSYRRSLLVCCSTKGPEAAKTALVSSSYRSIAAHPDGRTIAMSYRRELTLTDLDHDEQSISWPFELDVQEMFFSPDGSVLASVAGSVVALWDIAERKQRHALIGHEGLVRSVAFTPDNRSLLTGSHDRTVKLWDVQTGRLVRTYAWPIGPVLAVAAGHDGLTAAAGSNSGEVVIWDLDLD